MLPDFNKTPLIETGEYLKTAVDWSRYFKLVALIGNSLNSNKDRFDKSDILEHSLEIFSDGHIKWIDENGADHILPNGNRMEMKYVCGCLQSKKRRTKRVISSIKLMNSLGTCSHTTLPKTYADYLLISDSHMVCLIDSNALSRYIVTRGDGLNAEGIPVSQVFVVETSLVEPRIPTVSFDYAAEKRQMQKRFIEQIV